MPVFSFRTLQAPVSGIYKEKGSKFLAFGYPVANEQEVKAQLAVLQKKYFDARHHCFAWVLGADKTFYRAYDDGEPNHSAGDPILGQIRSKDLTNILVVVIRYFGGVKLGVGGLIQAYKTAAEQALNQGVIIEREVAQTLKLVFDYASTSEVMKLVKDFDLTLIDQSFTDDCKMKIEYKLVDKEKLMDKIRFMSATGVNIKIV
jgi:uncharacterized YigZ family protein